MSARLISIDFNDIPDWHEDDHLAAFQSFLVSAEKMVEKPYKTRALGVDGLALADVAKIAIEFSKQDVTPDTARHFFETAFRPHVFDGEAGFLTGYYEPVVAASKTHSDQFSEPLHLRPSDLIDITDENRPPNMGGDFRYGRKSGSHISEYFDREAISKGALAGRGLELVYVQDKVDAFFIHVQGSAKLELAEGGLMRVTYAAKSGHPYSSIAKILCERLGVPPAKMTADRLKNWMYDNPDDLDELLFNNHSFIFFEEVQGSNVDSGPVAAAKTPLIAGRSIAVDRTLHTFGTPIWLTTETPLPSEAKPLSRLMMAHDTGSAIVGPARADIFIGSGDEAGFAAGRVRHDSDMVVFMPVADLKIEDISVQ